MKVLGFQILKKGFVVALLVAHAGNLVAQNGAAPATPRPVVLPDRFQRLGVAEFEKLRARPDAVVVDVRTAAEFAEGHLPKAGFVDVKTEGFLGTIAGLDRSKLYLVNCAAGGRSARACLNFAALGFTNVVNLEGGFNAWKKEHPDLVSREGAVELPKSPTPNMRQSGTASVPPPPRQAPTSLPALESPVIINRTTK